MSRIFKLLACVAFAAALAFPSAAQDLGNVGFRTVVQKIFSGQQNPVGNIVSPIVTNPTIVCTPANNAPCGIPNLGQNVHFVSFIVSTTNPTFKIVLEATNDNTTWFPISEGSSDTNFIGAAQQISGFSTVGVYAGYRINFIGGNSGGIFNIWYTGGFVNNPAGSGSVNPSNPDRRIIAVAPNAAGLPTLVPGSNFNLFPPYGSTAGTLYAQYVTNACAGGTITITAGPDVNHKVAVATIALANNLTLQTFPIPDVKAALVFFSSSACGTETFDVQMMFARPGSAGATGTGATQVQTTGADPCASTAIAKSSAVVTAPAAATTQIIAGVAGQQIFVCGYNIGVVVAVAGTVQWTTGTGGTCAAATVPKTGAIPINTAEPFSYGPGSTLFTAAAGSGVCITLTGAGDNGAGIVDFVQQ